MSRLSRWGMHPCDLTWLPKAVACALRFGRKSVAKQRIVNTKFWDDSYILNLKPIEKLIFLYLLTNPLTNISGVYELPLERVAFDIGISREKIDGVFKKLEADRKLVLSNGWVGIVNFIKHQTLNPKVKQGIMAELKRAPKEIVERLAIDYRSLSIADDGLSHSNSNSNSNLNFNSNSNADPLKEFSTVLPREIQEKRGALVRKWRI